MSAKYIIHKQKLIEQVKFFGENADVYYPVKANSDKKVLEILDSFVKGYEVDSFFHLRDLIKKHHVEPQRIIYSSPIKDIQTIAGVIKLGVRRIVVDNLTDFYSIVEIANDRQIEFIIRVDISEFIATKGLMLKWGASVTEICELKKQISSGIHKFLGLSFYLPQEVNNNANFCSLLSNLEQRIGFNDCEILDIGGGIAATDLEAVVQKIKAMPTLSNVGLIIEPGRHLLDPCIDMLVEITAIRIKQGKKLMFINSSIYNGLLDVIIKGKKFKIEPIKEDTSSYEEYIICGSSADISDILGEYKLPKNMQVGDKLRILNCGAYCSEMATMFCKNKKANYIVGF